MSVAGYERCVCKERVVPHCLCDGKLAFQENGKKIRLTLKSEEEGVALVLDGCVFRDKKTTKCEGLFLWKKGSSKKCVILVELKGTDIEHAFKQIAYVRGNRPEYRQIVEAFKSYPGTSTVLEKAVIVSNGALTKPQWVKLENQYGFRVVPVLDSDATTRVTDARELCR
ncbi:hypothetical protein FGF66_01235 [Chlorobaculum thiosulfatiphilum]|uniref:Uncharacterized protein n=1 Tax=Chlorobaculum thiosulfatiphilum TaxID=115852 RepID=A0A5C4SA84_CHLTI|nr:hypothetical protein FGF66_01235 [Chlorobaculum thiosulfatiphilum]